MADKSSRALVLYGDGLARFISPAQTHLHSFASRACCGFLALPHPPPSENEDTRIIREFAELLDANEAYQNLALLPDATCPVSEGGNSCGHSGVIHF
ncbi:UNVERIFIED_CONTAM: hypothetical protein Sradi_1704900 [Sesamum radiatum]|uniref:Uncharacterized protein n=1 Tax=Sesamum radiatum TaxID=300843 RepID=A0AAW2TS60_SESRA